MSDRVFVPVPFHSLLASLASCALYIRKPGHYARTTHSWVELGLRAGISNGQARKARLPTALDLSLLTQLASRAISLLLN